jgi:predicted TPR repeat methyltransferase
MTMGAMTEAVARESTARAASDNLAALGHAIALLRAERIDEAEPALLSILRRCPDQPDALHFLGVLRHAQGRVDESVALIRGAVAQVPQHAAAWNNLGNVLLLAGQPGAARHAYEQAVAHGAAADARQALNNLGILHRKLGRLVESEQALRRALEIDEAYADAWYNLSTTLIKLGKVHDGIVAHSLAVALWPEAVQSRQEVIRALLVLHETERAARLLREWLAADPGNPVAEHMLAACSAGASATCPERASDRYIQQVFDGFASSFDAKLESLHYRAPELVVQALQQAVGAVSDTLDIVDAGCGTGLCGPGLKPFARRLAGCDLSVGMLRRAKARTVYDVLHQAELTHYLVTQPASFDVVASADTLCYFGALESVLAAARACLRPGGTMIFTVEALPEGGLAPFRLQTNGRYAHGRGYLLEAAAGAGFAVERICHEQLRLEAGEPVHGWLVSLRAQAA